VSASSDRRAQPSCPPAARTLYHSVRLYSTVTTSSRPPHRPRENRVRAAVHLQIRCGDDDFKRLPFRVDQPDIEHLQQQQYRGQPSHRCQFAAGATNGSL